MSTICGVKNPKSILRTPEAKTAEAKAPAAKKPKTTEDTPKTKSTKK